MTTFISTLKERESQAREDLLTLGSFDHHVSASRRCSRCMQRVYTYAFSADGQRVYCRCIRKVPQ